MSDQVNSPAHYNKLGGVEAIEVIEGVAASADDAVSGYLVGSALKYILRMWHKGNSLQDAEKARWFLNRLIDRMKGNG